MLIVGCGDVGRRLARAALGRGERVGAIVRRPESAAALTELGISAVALDLDEPVRLDPRLAAARQVYYLAPPPPDGTQDPRLAHFLEALPAREGRRIVYISTTGVYGDCAGAWVDESRPADPQVDRARRRHDAEQRLRDWRTAGGGELILLRVAGIYGPDKLPLARLRQQVPMIAAADAPWTNRIHIDDLVAVCEAAMARGTDGEVYNVSDGRPGNMREYFDQVADLFQLPRAPVITLAEARRTLSPGMLSYLAESRRLDNRKMREQLGLTLRYPNLASGLRAIRDLGAEP
jgi:nucleoside-diphosphate-sugar epimerase